jgi:hypothetical protein
LLLDLHEHYRKNRKPAEFAKLLAALRTRHGGKSRFIERLDATNFDR